MFMGGMLAVTQKSPCKGKRVLMGEESALKLSQRGLDARQGGAHEPPEAIIRPRPYEVSPCALDLSPWWRSARDVPLSGVG